MTMRHPLFNGFAVILLLLLFIAYLHRNVMCYYAVFDMRNKRVCVVKNKNIFVEHVHKLYVIRRNDKTKNYTDFSHRFHYKSVA